MSQVKSMLKPHRLLSIVLVIVLFLGVLPFSARADTYDGYIELDGSFDGRFTLDSSTSELFNLKNIVPGDEWSGTLHIKNSTDDDMEFAIVSVESVLEDNLLFDALKTKITVKEELREKVIYNDTYGYKNEESYMTKYFTISSGRTLDIKINVSLPPEVGNEMQAKSMDSVWTFEARYYGHQPESDPAAQLTVYYLDEDGNDLVEPKVKWATIGNRVTEEAIEIKGYTPDEEIKSVVMKEGGSEIIFVYTKDDSESTEPTPTPVPTPGQDDDDDGNQDKDRDPSTPTDIEDKDHGGGDQDDPTITPDSKDEPPKTGYDTISENSGNSAVLWIVVLTLLCAAIISLRIVAIKRRQHQSDDTSRI